MNDSDGRPANGEEASRRGAARSPVWVDATALAAAISGPVVLLNSRHGGGPFFDLDTGAILAGLLVLASALWLAVIEPRIVAHPRLADSPGFAAFAAGLGYAAVAMIVWRVIDHEDGFVTLPVLFGAAMALGGAAVQTGAFVVARRRESAERAGADAESHARAAFRRR